MFVFCICVFCGYVLSSILICIILLMVGLMRHYCCHYHQNDHLFLDMCIFKFCICVFVFVYYFVDGGPVEAGSNISAEAFSCFPLFALNASNRNTPYSPPCNNSLLLSKYKYKYKSMYLQKTNTNTNTSASHVASSLACETLVRQLKKKKQ